MPDEISAHISRAERRRLKQEKQQEIASRLRHRQWIGRSVITLILIFVASAGGYGLYGWWTSEAPGEFVPSVGNAHIPSPDFPHIPYNSDPPTSGPHLSSLARWGVHSQPPPQELLVHNMEDGGVVVQYNCAKTKNCDSIQEQLARIIRDYDHVVLAPYPTMDSAIALTAWTRIKKLDRVEEKKSAASSKPIST